jgi:hypothetical protein
MSEHTETKKTEEQVIWIPGNLYVEDFVTQGKTSVHGTPVDEYLKSTPGAVLISYEEFSLKIKETEDREYLKPWEEIDESQWTEKLEVLPPEKWLKCGPDAEAFRMMEYYSGNITGHYIRISKRYFSALRRTSQDYKEMTQEIKEQFSF